MAHAKYERYLVISSIIISFIIVSVASASYIPSGTPDPDFVVDIYKPDMTWNGTTLFADYHTTDNVRIVEVNMNGEIVWQYAIPDNLKRYTNPGFDVQLLPNDHIMFLLPGKGVYEIDRNGNVLWSYLDPQGKASHDFKRLPNGNTLINRGNEDTKDTAQAIEVDPQGKIVWQWFAKSEYDKQPYSSIYREGWTHVNAVTRLPNGNTLINMRNFNITAEVNPEGAVVWQYDWSPIGQNPHEPELLPNGNILVNLHPQPILVAEVNPKTSESVWRYKIRGTPTFHPETRDADRLPNGNTLMNSGVSLIEVTPAKEVVWQLTVKSLMEMPTTKEIHGLYLYKSERIGYMDPQFSILSPQQGKCFPKETDISISYSDVDLNHIWYRIYDNNGNKWVTDNITYVRNKWANAITFAGKETGQEKVTLGNGDYTLHVWASSNGWGDENLYVPKKVITIEKTVDFKVTSDCAIPQSIYSTSVSGTSPAGTTTMHSTTTPLPWEIALAGIIIAGFARAMRKKDPEN
jgi:hypothetical protein